jgi:hypothetical protein
MPSGGQVDSLVIEYGLQDEEIQLKHLANESCIILDRLESFQRKGGYTTEDLRRQGDLLHSLQEKSDAVLERVRSKGGSKHLALLAGLPALTSSLSRCFRRLHLLYGAGEVHPQLEPLFTQLEQIKNHLQSQYALRKTDIKLPAPAPVLEGEEGFHVDEGSLQQIREKLLSIENTYRSGGVFCSAGAGGSGGAPQQKDQPREVLAGQATLHDLLDHCYQWLRKFEVYFDENKPPAPVSGGGVSVPTPTPQLA